MTTVQALRSTVINSSWASLCLLYMYCYCVSSSDVRHADGADGGRPVPLPKLQLPRPHPEVRRILRGAARLAESHPLRCVSGFQVFISFLYKIVKKCV